MGVSTDGQMCFGILFDEDYQFPWDSDGWDGDYEDWWIKEVCQYEPPFKLYNEDGEYINGIKPAESKITEYFKHKRDFRKQYPIPVQLVNGCSANHPLYIIAVPSSIHTCSRGYPRAINTTDFQVNDKDIVTLIDFCEKYCSPRNDYDKFPEMNPQWYLSSYWG